MAVKTQPAPSARRASEPLAGDPASIGRAGRGVLPPSEPLPGHGPSGPRSGRGGGGMRDPRTTSRVERSAPVPAPTPPATLSTGVSVDTSGPDVRVEFELNRPPGRGSYLVGLRAGDADRTTIRHLIVSLRDGRFTGQSTYDFGTATRTVHSRGGASCAGASVTALPAGIPDRAGGRSPHHRVQLPQRTGTPNRDSPHPDGDRRPQAMSGQPADFSRHSPDTGTARDYAIFYTREPAGDADSVEKQLDAHLGQCSSL